MTMSLWGSLILVQRPYHWHGLLGFVSCLPLGGGNDTISSKSWNNIYTMSCRNSSRFFIYDNIFGPWGLYLLVWSELGQSQPFSSMRDLRMQWSWAFRLVCQVALSIEVGKLARCISTLVYCYELTLISISKAWWLKSKNCGDSKKTGAYMGLILV